MIQAGEGGGIGETWISSSRCASAWASMRAPFSTRPGRCVFLRRGYCPWGAENGAVKPEIAISRSRHGSPTSGSGCDVYGGPRPVANTTDLIGAGVAKLGPGTPTAPAIPHVVFVGEAEWGWWGGGRSMPPLEHLTVAQRGGAGGRACAPCGTDRHRVVRRGPCSQAAPVGRAAAALIR